LLSLRGKIISNIFSFRGNRTPKPSSKFILKYLIFSELKTKWSKIKVEYPFNNTMYKQMVSLWAVHSIQCMSIFFRYHKAITFWFNQQTYMYQRYIDDTFAIFKTESNCEMFFIKLKSLHPSLKFNMEKVNKIFYHFSTSKLRKAKSNFWLLFTANLLSLVNIGPSKCKTNLIGTLIHRALKFCSKTKLDCIKAILCDNSYTENIIKSSISKKIVQLQEQTKGPQKCPSICDLPGLAKFNLNSKHKVKFTIKKCCKAAQLHITFSQKILPLIYKDNMSTIQQSTDISINKCTTVTVST